MEYLAIKKFKKNPNNPRTITDEKFERLVKSIKDFPKMLELRPIVTNEDFVVLGGNMRLKACVTAGLKKVPHLFFTQEDSEEANRKTNQNKSYLEWQDEFIIKDNVGFGDWDWNSLNNDWSSVKLQDWGMDIPTENWLEDEATEKKEDAHVKLTERFIIPPFTVLDTRQGHWQERKKHWKSLIQDNGESREGTLAKGDTNIMAETNNGVSLLDPVLAELSNLWFGVPNGKTFDCFAGDSVFGYVSDFMGNSFTGIELRKEQADLNNIRLKGSDSKYICDDGQNVAKHIEKNSQDLLFSCPPYFDLEVYSELENDASNQKEYKDFLKILDNAFSNAINCLKDNRFAVVVVGDIRNKKGHYYRFPDHIKDIFEKNNMPIYNEMILVETLGTLPQRVGRYMNNRKIGKCHQNILVFYKGDTTKIKEIYPKLEVTLDIEKEVKENVIQADANAEFLKESKDSNQETKKS